VLVGCCKNEEVVDEPLHRLRRAEYTGPELLRIDGARVAQGELEREPLGRQGALKVVGDVGDELALPGHGHLDPGQHPVHGRGETADLVPRSAHDHPPVELVRVNGVDLGTDPVEPAECAPDQQPDHDAEQQHGERYADQQQRAQAT
jgi:hypothetical protein